MLADDAIRPSQSPFSSNVVVVRKKDSFICFCVDYRKLKNRTIKDAQATIKDAQAIPKIEDMLHLHYAKYFMKSHVTYLGHVVSENGIETHPDKTEAIRS